MSLALVACLGAGAWVALAPPDRRALRAFAALMLFLIVYSRPVLGTSTTPYSGLSTFEPRLENYLPILVLGAILKLPPKDERSPVRSLIPFVVGLATFLTVVWNTNPTMWSGVLQLMCALLALHVGARLGRAVLGDLVDVRALALILFAVCFIELVVASGQALNLISWGAESSAAAMEGRVSGTTSHPNTLGKIMVLILPLVLALASSADDRTRGIAWTTLPICLLANVLTGGRATLVAALTTLLLWLLLSRKPDRKQGRAVPVAMAVIAAVPFVGAVLSRFDSDPAGGSRGVLTDVALTYLPHYLWYGMGPNEYVAVVGSTDVKTAVSGLPVHNAFLLIAAEMGLILGLAFWLGIGTIYFRLWRGRSSDGVAGALAVSTTCSLPGVFLLIYTGWGMINGVVFVLWFLLLGVAFTAHRPAANVQDLTSRPGMRPRTG